MEARTIAVCFSELHFDYEYHRIKDLMDDKVLPHDLTADVPLCRQQLANGEMPDLAKNEHGEEMMWSRTSVEERLAYVPHLYGLHSVLDPASESVAELVLSVQLLHLHKWRLRAIQEYVSAEATDEEGQDVVDLDRTLRLQQLSVRCLH